MTTAYSQINDIIKLSCSSSSLSDFPTDTQLSSLRDVAPLFVRQVAPLVDNIDDDWFGFIGRRRTRARAHTNVKPPEGRQREEEGSVKTSPTFANMDSLTFIEFAKTLTRLKMYPYFDVANYILMCWTVREDNHPQGTGKGRNAGYTVSYAAPVYLFLEVAWPSSSLYCLASAQSDLL